MRWHLEGGTGQYRPRTTHSRNAISNLGPHAAVGPILLRPTAADTSNMPHNTHRTQHRRKLGSQKMASRPRSFCMCSRTPIQQPSQAAEGAPDWPSLLIAGQGYPLTSASEDAGRILEMVGIPPSASAECGNTSSTWSTAFPLPFCCLGPRGELVPAGWGNHPLQRI